MNVIAKILVITVTIVVGGISGFLLFGIPHSEQVVADNHTHQRAAFDMVDTLEEAESDVGYKVSVPKYIPNELERGKIAILQPVVEDHPKAVFQHWILGNSTGGVIVQDNPDLKGLIRGIPYTINGVQGQRALYPTSIVHDSPQRGIPPEELSSEGREYDILAFFWRNEQEDRAHAVIGTLVDPIDEEMLLRIVESVEIRQ